MSLSVMAYNLKRAINILGVPKLIEALHLRAASTQNIFGRLLRVLSRGAARLIHEFSHNLSRC